MSDDDKPFVHLHVHSDRSLLDGAALIPDMVKAAVADGQPALGITDHGNLYGLFEHYNECKKAGIIPVLGIESYYDPDSRLNRTPRSKTKAGDDALAGLDTASTGRTKDRYHQLMLAVTTKGYHNLVGLASEAFLTGFYYKARSDFELLEKYHDGLIITTSCLGGMVPQALVQGQPDEAFRIAGRLQDIVGKENFYVELQDHDIPLERGIRTGLLEVSRRVGAPLLATNDSHFVREGDAQAHSVMLCIQTNAKMTDEKRYQFSGHGYWMRTTAQMYQLFSDLPQACLNTWEIAQRAQDVRIETITDPLPHYEVPEQFRGEPRPDAAYLRHLVYEGACRRYHELTTEITERTEYELGVIDRMGYSAYFLIVWDITNWCRNNGVQVGPGRGCLTGDASIITPDGPVALQDIRAGDQIRNRFGMWSKVANTFRYDINEPTVQLACYYDHKPVEMTTDHKVWTRRAVRWPGGIFRYHGDPEWAAAGTLTKGDLVAMPQLASSGHAPTVMDLAAFAAPQDIVRDNEIIERVTKIGSGWASIRGVARLSGVPQASLHAFMRGTATPSAEQIAVLDTATASWGFASYETWKTQYRSYRETTYPRYLEINEDFCRLLGMFISDGWLNKRAVRMFGLCCRRSQDDGSMMRGIRAVWGEVYARIWELKTDCNKVDVSAGIPARVYRQLLDRYENTPATKHLPDWFIDLSESCRWALVEGLWWGDGRADSKTSYTTVSPLLARQVRDLLWSLGVPNGLYEYPPKLKDLNNWSRSRTYEIAVPRDYKSSTLQRAITSDGQWTWMALRKVDIQEAQPRTVYDLQIDGPDPSYCTTSFAVHNSAAGSIVTYCTGISDLDPLRWGLMFERFLNPDRVSMPDIDMDIDDRHRPLVLAYIAERFGADRVAQIITFSTIGSRSAVADAARVLDLPYALGREIVSAMPPLRMGRDISLAVCLSPERPEQDPAGWDRAASVRELASANPDANRVLQIARGLEGRVRQDGLHAAAVVISNRPLQDIIPVQRKPVQGSKTGEMGPLTTQYDMHAVEKIGLLKMDWLGVRTLTVIGDALDMIHATTGQHIERLEIQLDDERTYKMISAGHAVGVFQLEQPEFRRFAQALAPTTYDDIGALVALYRPGPMGTGMHIDYADRRNGRKANWEPMHPAVADILQPTFGLMIYQETMMQVAQKLAGFTLAEADNLRKACGKKDTVLLASLHDKFVQGCVDQGFGKQVGEQVFAAILPFSDYAFNKSHAYAYGLLTYWTAWLKANWPAHYMAALISSVKDDTDRREAYLAECRRMGLVVLSPDINAAHGGFSVRQDVNGGWEVVFGFSGIKGLGDGCVDHLEAVRRSGGPFQDFWDFAARIDPSRVTQPVLEALIAAGAFDHMGYSRKGLTKAGPGIVRNQQARGKLVSSGVQFLFDDEPAKGGEIEKTEWPKRTLQAKERAVLNTYVSSHPLDDLMDVLRRSCDTGVMEMLDDPTAWTDRDVVVGGMVDRRQEKITKKGHTMGTFTLVGIGGSLESIIFPKQWDGCSGQVINGEVVKVTGQLRMQEGNEEVTPQFIASAVERLAVAEGRPIRIKLPDRDPERLQALQTILRRFPGDSPVYLTFPDGKLVQLPAQWGCEPSVVCLKALHDAAAPVSVPAR